MSKKTISHVNFFKRNKYVVWLLVSIVISLFVGLFFYPKKFTINLKDFFFSESKKEKILRGSIYDRNFKELAYSVEKVSVYCRPKEIGDIGLAILKLSQVLDLSERQIEEKFNHEKLNVWLAKDITQEIEERIEQLELPGVYLHRDQKRIYPENEKAAHLLGFSEKNMGLSGAEFTYNFLLTNKNITQKQLPYINLAGEKKTGEEGQHVVLTMDLKIQIVIEKLLKTLSKQGSISGGSIMLMNLGSGELIAGASYPFYNPNIFWQFDLNVVANKMFSKNLLPVSIKSLLDQAYAIKSIYENQSVTNTHIPWSIVSPVKAKKGEGVGRLLVDRKLNEDFFSENIDGYDSFIDKEDNLFASPVGVAKILLHMFCGNGVSPHLLTKIIDKESQKEFYHQAFLKKYGSRMQQESLMDETMKMMSNVGLTGSLDSFMLVDNSTSVINDREGLSKLEAGKTIIVFIPYEKEILSMIIFLEKSHFGPENTTGLNNQEAITEINEILLSVVALQQVRENYIEMLKHEEKKENNFQSAVKVSRSNAVRLKRNTNVYTESSVNIMPNIVGLSLRMGLRKLGKRENPILINGYGIITKQVPVAGAKISNSEKIVVQGMNE